MDFQIHCECGATLSVGRGAAGSTTVCECGATVAVPSLAEMDRQASASNAASARPVTHDLSQAQREQPARKLSMGKKLVFASFAILLCAGPLWFVSEVAYRWFFGIPLTGGIVSQDDLRMADTPVNRGFVSRFRLSDNPVLFYEPTPGAESGKYVINSHGFRDREFATEKAPGVFRIVVLGDSIIWGHRLALEDSFAKQLERKLNEAFDQPFEVLNFGVSGYSTQQEVELFKVKASRFQPDLVIVGYCLNDYKESSAEGAAFRRQYYDIFSKSYVYDHLRRSVLGLSYNTLGVAFEDSKTQHDLNEQFALLQSYCGGQRNVVVIFPMLFDFDDYLFAFEHLRVRKALEGLNYETLELLDVYRDYDPDSLLIEAKDRTHPNARGNEIAAQATMDLLIDQNLIPPVD